MSFACIHEVGEDPGCRFRFLVQPPRLDQLLADLLEQPGIFCETEQVEHAVFLTPAHQLLTCKTGITTHSDQHLGPALANALDKVSQYLRRTSTLVSIRGPKLGAHAA